MLLLIFEFLGTTELLVILVVALILFGPRRLPELGRSLGRSLSEFKRASEDFKRTWEMEVERERIEREAEVSRAMIPEEPQADQSVSPLEPQVAPADNTVARSSSPLASEPEKSSGTEKRDWL